MWIDRKVIKEVGVYYTLSTLSPLKRKGKVGYSENLSFLPGLQVTEP